jgi:hypothetical protein
MVRRAGWSDRLGLYGLNPATLAEFTQAGLGAANPVTLEPQLVAAAVRDRL